MDSSVGCLRATLTILNHFPTNPLHPLAFRGTQVLGLEKILAKDLDMGFRYFKPLHTHYPMSCFQVPGD